LRQKAAVALMATFAALLLLSAVVADSEAKKKPSYKVVVNIKYVGNAECIAQHTDEAYYRVSSEVKNPNNNDNHDQLVVKGEKENLGKYLIDLQHKKKPLVITFIGKFDPKKFYEKYHSMLSKLREYIEHYKNHVEVQDEYKPLVTFDLKRTQYTFNHIVDFGCG
jgi:hypothetical protein